jgi:hypothetical protein
MGTSQKNHLEEKYLISIFGNRTIGPFPDDVLYTNTIPSSSPTFDAIDVQDDEYEVADDSSAKHVPRHVHVGSNDSFNLKSQGRSIFILLLGSIQSETSVFTRERSSKGLLFTLLFLLFLLFLLLLG